MLCSFRLAWRQFVGPVSTGRRHTQHGLASGGLKPALRAVLFLLQLLFPLILLAVSDQLTAIVSETTQWRGCREVGG